MSLKQYCYYLDTSMVDYFCMYYCFIYSSETIIFPWKYRHGKSLNPYYSVRKSRGCSSVHTKHIKTVLTSPESAVHHRQNGPAIIPSSSLSPENVGAVLRGAVYTYLLMLLSRRATSGFWPRAGGIRRTLHARLLFRTLRGPGYSKYSGKKNRMSAALSTRLWETWAGV